MSFRYACVVALVICAVGALLSYRSPLPQQQPKRISETPDSTIDQEVKRPVVVKQAEVNHDAPFEPGAATSDSTVIAPSVNESLKSDLRQNVNELKTAPEVKKPAIHKPPIANRDVAAPPPAAPDLQPLDQEPLARVALSLVGIDSDAEAVWAETINDPTIEQDVRRELIEDLNEDGFPDPKNITEDDLPLILSRIQLIEQLAPEAMDSINLEAFNEAYKDLQNMLDKVAPR